MSDFESNRIIAQLQVDGARSLMDGKLAPVTGAVRSVHTYLKMCVIDLVHLNDELTTCPTLALKGPLIHLLFQMGRP
jgi:neutral ceramidase